MEEDIEMKKIIYEFLAGMAAIMSGVGFLTAGIMAIGRLDQFGTMFPLPILDIIIWIASFTLLFIGRIIIKWNH